MARGRHYRIERKLDTRRIKPGSILVISLLVVTAISATVFIILSRTKEIAVDTTENRPIAGVVQSATSNYVLFEEPEYKIRLPEGWSEQDRRDDQNYDYVVYAVDTEISTGRSLTVYRNYNKEVPAVTKILPVTVDHDKIRTERISEQCHLFTDLTETELDQPAPSKWGNVNFMCNPNKIWNHIGVSTEEGGPGVDLKGRHFEFVFIDHSAQIENSIFTNALKSFEAR